MEEGIHSAMSGGVVHVRFETYSVTISRHTRECDQIDLGFSAELHSSQAM